MRDSRIDAAIGVLITGISVALWIAIPWIIAPGTTGPVNSRTMPRIVAIVTAGAGLMLALESGAKARSPSRRGSAGQRERPRAIGPGLLWLAGVAAYVIVAATCGYLVPTIVMAIATVALLDRRRVSSYLWALGSIIVLYLTFHYVLGVRFP